MLPKLIGILKVYDLWVIIAHFMIVLLFLAHARTDKRKKEKAKRETPKERKEADQPPS